MWQRSEQYGFKYTTLISDGDSSTYVKLVEMNVYGDEDPVEKEDCINHMQKRVTNGLEEVKKTGKAQGVKIGGRQKKGEPSTLTEPVIAQLASYYR